ncbi:hypothetical protein [Photorhabdus sp. RM96S]|uniref:hypothetical protein n=1 Tax=Photorhabdus sp. RM96S TaxID=3342822 RepID=UPI0036D8C5F0
MMDLREQLSVVAKPESNFLTYVANGRFVCRTPFADLQWPRLFYSLKHDGPQRLSNAVQPDHRRVFSTHRV